jgi:N-acetylneuraminic acid mutarotase
LRYCNVRKPILAFLAFCSVFTTSAQSWQAQPPFPGISRDDAVGEVINQRGFFGTGFGTGFVYLNDWWEYDFTTLSWTQRNSLPSAPRQYAASCIYEQKIFIGGGILNSGNTTSEIWMYDTQKDEWEFETSFPGGGRQAPVLVSVYNSLYMGLGRNDTIYYNDWWKYDLYSRTWQQLNNVPFNHRYDAEGIETTGKIFVGLGKDSIQCYHDWWEFDVNTLTWNQKLNYPGQSCAYTAVSAAGEWLLVYGGTDFSNIFSDEFFAYRISSNEWTALDVIPGNPRKGGTALTYAGNYFYVSGIDSVFFRTPEVWKLDYSTSVLNDVILYPNPTGDWLCSSLQVNFSDAYLLEVYSLVSGQRCYTAPIDYFKGCFFVNDLAAGFYMARLKYGDTYFQSFTFLKE